MNKLWLVFRHEYLRHVLRKRFLFALLSLPFFILVMVAIGILSVAVSYNGAPIGYVDQSGVLDNPLLLPKDESLLFPDPGLIAYTDEESARSALTAGDIQAFYLVPPDYLQSGKVYLTAKDSNANSQQLRFRQFLQLNLLRNHPQSVSDRILEGPSITILSSDFSRHMDENNILGIMLPVFAGVLFIIAINSSGGYLLQAVVEEKENRTMEIVVTSISPDQLMAGKILGNLSVGLTQLVIWILFSILALFLARYFFPIAEGFSIDLTSVWLMLVTLLPAFVMIAALMAMLGATATEAREAQQIAGLFTLPVVVPYWFMSSIMENPNGPIATILSIFPLTAPVSLPLRAVFTIVPAWQIITTIALLLIVAAGAIWLAGRAFRLGMLRYGKRLSLRDIFARNASA